MRRSDSSNSSDSTLWFTNSSNQSLHKNEQCLADCSKSHTVLNDHCAPIPLLSAPYPTISSLLALLTAYQSVAGMARVCGGMCPMVRVGMRIGFTGQSGDEIVGVLQCGPGGRYRCWGGMGGGR
eukprot:764554-Hanusia_phi.AAC.2